MSLRRKLAISPIRLFNKILQREKLLLLKVQFLKYFLVGGLNFVFGLVCFYVLLHVFSINYLLAFSITWILGVLLTYIINFIWVFKPEEKFTIKSRLVKYTVVYLTSYVINLLLLKLTVENTGYDPLYLQFAITPIVIVINFTGMKFWALKVT